MTPAERERDIIAREKLANILQVLADQKASIERIDERERQLAEKDQQREKEMQELRSRLDKLEGKPAGDPGQLPWWRKLFEKGQEPNKTLQI